MYTSHGHQVDGTPVEGNRPQVTRCGGPVLCSLCAIQAAHAAKMFKFLNKDNEIKGLNMQFDTYTRKPFTVEAIEITEDNILELAEFIGTVRKKEDETPYIHVDKRLIPNVYVFRVYLGFFMTRMGDNVRCYSPKIFHDQFDLVSVTLVTNDGEETPDV